jgi:DNA-binding MarR family transcriptional regulator
MSKPERDPSDPAVFELEHFLPYRLSLLTNTVSQGIARSYRDRHDISVTEWRILAVLGRFPGLTASELVERTAMDKVSISRAVKSLEEKGLLRRETDRGDRRRMRLHITARRGRSVLSEVVPGALAYERWLLESLDQPEAETLFRILDKLQQQAESM